MATSDTDQQKPKIGIKKVGASSVLTPGESLTYQNCKELEDLIQGLINKNQTRIILDFKTAAFMDSKALELMLQLHNTLKHRGGALKITGLNAVCRDILLATRLVNVLHVYEDIAEALRSYP
ncbi:MAG: STAS domain-containing protein [Desulfobacterales bacterium]|uniref:STAS domain-containing protein n=1 Tax=Candidatus Desulfatibia profunda TaxID=2841695 RepID=A0A8J6THK6_9BACT|nr:STAS domain-containing protein [Candidatus Desulfatibia profunda]MBL7181178.1 STAS domain-containing protein [Desulfobacterales bacterium]